MTDKLLRSAVAGIAIMVLTGLAACGQQEPAAEPTRAEPSSARTASPPAAPSPSASGVPSAGGSRTPDKGNTVELRGTVEAGVEAGCLIMRVDGRTYNLFGGDPNVVRPGARVVVRGQEQPDMVTTCQQGIPFQVVDARRQ